MKILHIIKITFSLVFIFCLFSCVGKKPIITEEQQITPPQLLFLNYKIEKVADTKTVSLINQITTDGKLKATILDKNNPTTGDLECIILDKDFNSLEKYSIKNPLKKTIEFINDSGEFEKKILDLDNAQFSLKLQLPPHSAFVLINEITDREIIKHVTTKIE
ncbi:hypothetical protein [Winogradskyella psychrotolerans]|uniref:hypothetical protein n=1 Tax=Winogradskyella psychrotolerans TaxID=1344585 RepID=UPI001C06CA73|nr:hypothetical protein [Winogradskyella psychrotolerans]MBU2928777.1 hypothetical protein [Winogradskyella psychrotolerans]